MFVLLGDTREGAAPYGRPGDWWDFSEWLPQHGTEFSITGEKPGFLSSCQSPPQVNMETQQKQSICTFATQFLRSFINSSWVDRYEETPPPHMVTMIWSLIVSLYGLGAFLGSLTINLVSRKLGRCVKTNKHKKRRLGVVVQTGCCCVLRKMAAACNGCISMAAGAIMLASKPVQSYEMIIAARILYGFSAGETLWCVMMMMMMMLSGGACLIGPTSLAAGLGQGIHLIYLTEISPTNIRGIVCQSAATFLSLGKLSAQVIGLRLVVQVDLGAQLVSATVCVLI